MKKYKRTIKGVSGTLYNTMKCSSRKRGHQPPSFSLGEFRVWLYDQPNFLSLYDKWVESDYDTKLKPSPDRIDNKLSYSLSNLQLMTWDENNKKHYNRVEGRGSIQPIGLRSWQARITNKGKMIHIKRSTDKQVVIDALETWKRENLHSTDSTD